MPHDLSHLGFLAGQIGRLITISTTPVIAGDSFEMDAVGALRLSPLRRGLAIDSTVDIITFYVPHRHVYGEQWIKFMKDGVNATPLFFFQAEDCIRDRNVTGVQTCALPICSRQGRSVGPGEHDLASATDLADLEGGWGAVAGPRATDPSVMRNLLPCQVGNFLSMVRAADRSEERRVGKECGSRGSTELYDTS